MCKLSNDRYSRKRQARHGGKNKRPKPQYNKNRIRRYGERPPRHTIKGGTSNIGKKYQELRTARDRRARKSIHDGKGWTDKLLYDMLNGVTEESFNTVRRKKSRGKRDTAKRESPISL